jgi:hypothetical protein
MEAELATDLSELSPADWEERVVLFYKYLSYLGGGRLPVGPEVLFGLGANADVDHKRHPQPPPVLDAGGARVFVTGDSTLWGVGKTGNKADSRDILPSLKGSFYNLRGAGLWGKGLADINKELRTFLFGYDRTVAEVTDYLDTGKLSSKKLPLWEPPSKLVENRAWYSNFAKILDDHGFSPGTPIYAHGVSKAYHCVKSAQGAPGTPTGPAEAGGTVRPMDPSKDIAIIFWGVNEVVEWNADATREVRPTRTWPRGLQREIVELCSLLKRFPRAVVVLGNDSTPTCPGWNLGAEYETWVSEIDRRLSAEGIFVVNGSAVFLDKRSFSL